MSEEEPSQPRWYTPLFKSLRKKFSFLAHKDKVKPIPQKEKSKWPFIVRLCLFMAFIVWMVIDGHRNGKYVPDDSFTTLARVDETLNIVWDDHSPVLKRGQDLGPNRLILREGMLKLVMNNGAELILQGPTELTLKESRSVFCSNGQISAHIPQTAVGFQVVTPLGVVTDRGTNFYMNIDQSKLDVHTIKGRVELTGVNNEKIDLRTGNASRITDLGRYIPIKIAPEKYVSVERFTVKLLESVKKIRLQEEKKILFYDNSPKLLARFDLSNKNQTTIPNAARYGSQRCPSLTLSGCHEAEGRLFGFHSTGFNNPDAMGSFHMDGTFENLTLVASVRIQSLVNMGNAIMVGNGYLREKGAFLWQVSRSGELLFHVTMKDNSQNETFRTPSVIKRSDWGRWCQLAVVINASRKTITHYLDGKRVATLPWNEPVPLKLNSGTIGNYFDKSGSSNNRYFGGSIDGIYLFDKALTSAEIRALPGIENDSNP